MITIYRPLIIGETCLLRNQLNRLNIKKEETNLFDDMKINLDSVSKIIEDDFSDILNPNYLQKVNYLYYPEHNIWHNKFLNLKYCIDSDKIFSWDVCCFFHFDIYNQEEFNSLIRKKERTKALLESDTPITLFYYYRYSDRQDTKKLKLKLSKLLDFLENKYKKTFNCCLITQKLGDSNHLDLLEDTKNIIHAHFTTMNSWIDIDDNWDGHKENMLFESFFSHMIYFKN